MVRQEVGGWRLEPDRCAPQMIVQPRLALPRLGGRDVDDLPGRLDGLHEWRRHRPASTDEHQHRRGQGVLDDLDQPGNVRSEQPPGFAYDHHPPVHEEGRGQAGVDDGANAELLPQSPADLLDDEGVVAVAHQVGQQGAHLLGHQRGIITLDEIRRRDLSAAHLASLTAASTSRTRQVPFTSCTRTRRQPQAMPRAAAPMEASRRSESSKSRIPPKNVLLDAESRSG